jgi:hypothetical protein
MMSMNTVLVQINKKQGVVLGTAETRLNRESRDCSSHKGGTRNMARFVAPLKKVQLCNPTIRPKTLNPRRPGGGEAAVGGHADRKKVGKPAAGKQSTLYLDEQATDLLLMSCRALNKGE